MAKSKFFRIAVEGATTDGREIQRDWLEQMAASYNPATYTARINCEHLRGFSPETPFNAYGSVLSLKTDQIDLSIDNKTEKRLALFAEIDANDQLLAINGKGQKLFTSCEIQPNFAGTDKAYLVGLAVTDSPASLGTEMLKFAAGQGDANPLAARKQNKDNLFTAAHEASIEVESAAPVAEESAFAKAMAAMTAFFSKGTTPPVTPSTPAEAPANDNDAAEGMRLMSASISALGEQFTAAIGAVKTDLASLKTDLERTPNGTQPQRQPASGGNGQAFATTDC
jgi:hypothetical protein